MYPIRTHLEAFFTTVWCFCFYTLIHLLKMNVCPFHTSNLIEVLPYRIFDLRIIKIYNYKIYLVYFGFHLMRKRCHGSFIILHIIDRQSPRRIISSLEVLLLHLIEYFLTALENVLKWSCLHYWKVSQKWSKWVADAHHRMEQFILELVAYLYALIGIETKLDFISPPKSPTNTDLTLGQRNAYRFPPFYKHW